MYKQPDVAVNERTSNYRRRFRGSSVRRISIRKTSEGCCSSVAELLVQATAGRDPYRDQSRNYHFERCVFFFLTISDFKKNVDIIKEDDIS